MPAQKGWLIKIELEFHSFDCASVTRKDLLRLPSTYQSSKFDCQGLQCWGSCLTLQLILLQSIAIVIVPKFKHWQFKHFQLRHYSFSAVVERAVPKIALNSTLPHLGTSFCFSQWNSPLIVDTFKCPKYTCFRNVYFISDTLLTINEWNTTKTRWMNFSMMRLNLSKEEGQGNTLSN